MFHTRYWGKLSQDLSIINGGRKRSKAPLRGTLEEWNRAPTSLQWLQREPREIKLTRLKLAFVNISYSLILLPWLHEHTNASGINPGWINLKFSLKAPASNIKTFTFRSTPINKAQTLSVQLTPRGGRNCNGETLQAGRYLLGSSSRVFSLARARGTCPERIWGIHVYCTSSLCNHIHLFVAWFYDICIKPLPLESQWFLTTVIRVISSG